LAEKGKDCKPKAKQELHLLGEVRTIALLIISNLFFDVCGTDIR